MITDAGVTSKAASVWNCNKAYGFEVDPPSGVNALAPKPTALPLAALQEGQ